MIILSNKAEKLISLVSGHEARSWLGDKGGDKDPFRLGGLGGNWLAAAELLLGPPANELNTYDTTHCAKLDIIHKKSKTTESLYWNKIT